MDYANEFVSKYPGVGQKGFAPWMYYNFYRNKLPNDVQKEIWSQNPTQRVVEGNLFDTRNVGNVSGATETLFPSDSSISEGTCNVSEGMPPTGMWFLVTSITLLYANSATPATADMTLIADDVRSGRMSIKQNNRVIFAQQMLEVFNTENRADIRIGTVPVPPVFLEPQKHIQVVMKFSAALGSSNESFRLMLNGAFNDKI